jgi:single-stranded-DNA-specific exonuclease
MPSSAFHKWIDPPQTKVPPSLVATVGGHPLVAKTLVRRGIGTPGLARAFLDSTQYEPSSAFALPDITAACERIERAVREGEPMCVWGDFDVDGQTSTVILLSALRELGAVASFYIPDRATESHGFHVGPLSRLAAQGVRLFVTCDTGIAARGAVERARQLGADCIVTDHHDLPTILPAAHAVINPKRLPSHHALRELPGAGCAFKLCEALFERAGKYELVERYLDLVALAIVADVAVQVRDTRYLLQRGLAQLRRGGRLGIEAIAETAQLDLGGLTENHISFVLAPRLNAVGRLGDARFAVELLTTNERVRARTLATQVEGLNARRKLLVEQILEAAEQQIRDDSAVRDSPALVLSHPAWPASVIGIVAGRLANAYNRPAVLISAPPGSVARGSARSIQGFDIHSAIAAQANMLEGFGGHPMAAGFSIQPDRIDGFQRGLAQTVARSLGPVPIPPSLQIDGYLPLSAITRDLAEDLVRMAPFGPGNPPLVLATRRLNVRSHTPLDRHGNHLRVTVADEQGQTAVAVYWNARVAELPGGWFDLAYRISGVDYRGEPALGIEWVAAQPEKAGAVELVPVAPDVDVVDLRDTPHALMALADICSEHDALVWSEADHASQVHGHDRYSLEKADALVIWTAPPGRSELQAVLREVTPTRVFVFAKDPLLHRPGAFLQRLARCIRALLDSHAPTTTLRVLAAATAARETTVLAGIRWLVEHGDVVADDVPGGSLAFRRGRRVVGQSLPQTEGKLKALLDETAAYRAHFARAPSGLLLR